jgi:hypothetical protein
VCFSFSKPEQSQQLDIRADQIPLLGSNPLLRSRLNLKISYGPSECGAVLCIAVLLSAPASAQPAGQSTTPPAPAARGEPVRPGNAGEKPLKELIGAGVLSKDCQLVGVIDDIEHDNTGEKVVVGLAGFLGLGEKDVAVPASQFQPATRAPRTSVVHELGDGKYSGGLPYRVVVNMTVQELAAAPAYTGKETGIPSANSGTPEDVKKEPRSSTKSGGPG